MGFAKKRPLLIILFIALTATVVRCAKTDFASDAVFFTLNRPISVINGIFKTRADFPDAEKTGHEKTVLKVETAALEELKRENRRLRRLLKLAELIPGKPIAANVTGASPSPFSYKILILDKGEKDGVREGMPVTAPFGGKGKTGGAIVGRILKSHRATSQTLLITDPASSVDVFTQRTRARGTVKGNGKGCIMDHIDAEADIKTGDVVLSSGRGGVYPRSMTVGTIGKIYAGSGIKKAEIIPAANPGSLEEVIVLASAADGR